MHCSRPGHSWVHRTWAVLAVRSHDVDPSSAACIAGDVVRDDVAACREEREHRSVGIHGDHRAPSVAVVGQAVGRLNREDNVKAAARCWESWAIAGVQNRGSMCGSQTLASDARKRHDCTVDADDGIRDPDRVTAAHLDGGMKGGLVAQTTSSLAAGRPRTVWEAARDSATVVHRLLN